jgi:hypothetical protein
MKLTIITKSFTAIQLDTNFNSKSEYLQGFDNQRIQEVIHSMRCNPIRITPCRYLITLHVIIAQWELYLSLGNEDGFISAEFEALLLRVKKRNAIS